MNSVRVKPLKVALVRPPTLTFESSISSTSTPPIGLAYVAAALREAHFEVYALDAPSEAISQYTLSSLAPGAMLHGLTYQQILERIHPDTDVIGVGVMFASEWLHTRELLRLIKLRFPKAHLTIGGEQATAVPEYCLKDCEAIDSCVVGEGELTMTELCRQLASGGVLSEVQGLVYRTDNVTVANPRRPRIQDIDRIAEPAWDLFNLEAYIANGYTHGTNLGRCIPMLASRGCPYQCTFCSNPTMWTTLWKCRTPGHVVSEMKKYMTRYNVTNFDFYDLTAIVRKEWIIEFCSLLIKENLKITWQLPSGTRSEVIDGEVAGLLFKSGCRNINYAPESGSPAELKRIKKKVNIEAMLKSMKSAVGAGLQIKANMIFGMPGATWSDVKNSFVFLARLAFVGVQDVSCFSFSPYPGSAMFNDLQKANTVVLGDEYYKKILTFNDPVKSISFNPNFSARQIQKLNYAAMLFFYGLSFSIRPWRFFRLVGALLTNDQSGKLAVALGNRKRKKQKMSGLRRDSFYYGLSRALLAQMKKDNTQLRNMQFAVYLEDFRAAAVVYRCLQRFEMRRIQSVICLLYGALSATVKYPLNQKKIAFFRFENEKTALQKYFQANGISDVAWVDLRRSLSPWRLLVNVMRIVFCGRLLRFYVVCLRHYPLFVVMRASQAYFYFATFVKDMSGSACEEVYFSTEGNPHGRALLEACAATGRRSHFICHAPSAIEPIAMRATSGHFVGAAGIEEYVKAGSRFAAVSARNFLFPAATEKIKMLSMERPLNICLCLSKESLSGQIASEIAELKQLFNVKGLAVRPHPTGLADISIPGLNMDLRLEQLQDFDLIVAGNSNVHFEALTRGLPALYRPGLDVNTRLLHSFIVDGTIFGREFESSDLIGQINRHYGNENFIQKFRHYIS